MSDQPLIASHFSYHEITDEVVRERWCVRDGYKLFRCTVRINGEKWIEFFVLSNDFIQDSAISWEKYLEFEVTNHAQAEYLARGETV